MSSKFVLRVRTPLGTKRLAFPGIPAAESKSGKISTTQTWKDLQKQLQKEYGIQPEEQLISTKSLTDPDFKTGVSPSTPIDSIFSHGDMLYIVCDDDQLKKTEAKAIAEKKAQATKRKYDLSKPWQKTLSNSAYVNDPEAKKKREEAAAGELFKPYHEWICERQKMYFNQPWLADPKPHDYSPVDVSNGRIQLGKMPPNASIRLQPYRHVSAISFKDKAAGHKFVAAWQKNLGLQRAALLFGRFIPDPHSPKEKGAVRAEISALYEPPQDRKGEGVKFKKDPRSKAIWKVVKALGLQPVGWCITTIQRGGKKYKGDILMSSEEIFQAAQFQARFADSQGHSKFVTMIMKPEKGGITPYAYQVSDQCVALVRDGAISVSPDRGMVRVTLPKKGEYRPAIIAENRRVPWGEDFLPDPLLVRVNATQPPTGVKDYFFKYLDFPNTGGMPEFRAYLKRHRTEEYHVMFSDFNILCFLPDAIGIDLTLQVCTAVKNRRRLKADIKSKIDKALAIYR